MHSVGSRRNHWVSNCIKIGNFTFHYTVYDYAIFLNEGKKTIVSCSGWPWLSEKCLHTVKWENWKKKKIPVTRQQMWLSK